MFACSVHTCMYTDRDISVQDLVVPEDVVALLVNPLHPFALLPVHFVHDHRRSAGRRQAFPAGTGRRLGLMGVRRCRVLRAPRKYVLVHFVGVLLVFVAAALPQHRVQKQHQQHVGDQGEHDHQDQNDNHFDHLGIATLIFAIAARTEFLQPIVWHVASNLWQYHIHTLTAFVADFADINFPGGMGAVDDRGVGTNTMAPGVLKLSRGSCYPTE